MNVNEFRKAAHDAVERIAAYYESLESRPVAAQVQPDFLRHSLPTRAPLRGEAWQAIADDFDEKILPGIMHWQHPSFFGYYPCNTTFEGILADMHAAAISNPGFNWVCSPSVTELELVTLDWVAKLLGLCDDFLTTSPSGLGGGVIMGSASEVTITVAIAARERMLSRLARRRPDQGGQPVKSNGGANGVAKNGTPTGTTSIEDEEDAVAAWRGETTSKLVMYGTTETHSVGVKACMILGLAFRALPVSASDDFGLRGETLRAALEQDRRRGRIPFMLLATLGTTSSAAVDDLTELARVAGDEAPDMWLHVDAAYAGVAMALPELRAEAHLDAINAHFDSFSTNLHKWGLVQFDCSPLFLRDRGALSNALTVTPEYLRTRQAEAASVLDLRNFSLSLGRRFRALKIWFVLRSYGVEGFQAHLRRGIELAQYFEQLVRARGAPFEIPSRPRWSLVAFRLNPYVGAKARANGDAQAQGAAKTEGVVTNGGDTAGHGDAKQNGHHAGVAATAATSLDALNRRLLQELELENAKLVLIHTVLPGVGVVVRLVVGSPSTQRHHIDEAWRTIQACAQRALAAWKAEEASAHPPQAQR